MKTIKISNGTEELIEFEIGWVLVDKPNWKIYRLGAKPKASNDFGVESYIYKWTFQAWGLTEWTTLKVDTDGTEVEFYAKGASSDFDKIVMLNDCNSYDGTICELWESIFWPGAFDSSMQSVRDYAREGGYRTIVWADNSNGFFRVLFNDIYIEINLAVCEDGFNLKIGEALKKLISEKDEGKE